MTISSRTRRATIYPYSSTNIGGYITSVYGPARGTYYCRFSQRSGTEGTSAGQAAHSEFGTFEFADEVTVDVNDLIVLGGTQWKVAASTIRPRQRSVIAEVYRTDEEPSVTPVGETTPTVESGRDFIVVDL